MSLDLPREIEQLAERRAFEMGLDRAADMLPDLSPPTLAMLPIRHLRRPCWRALRVKEKNGIWKRCAPTAVRR